MCIPLASQSAHTISHRHKTKPCSKLNPANTSRNTAGFGIKLGSDPTAWQIYDGRLFIFGDVLGHEAWKLDPAWNVGHADKLWPEVQDKGWRLASLSAYTHKVAHYKSGLQIKTEWEKKHPTQTWPSYNTGGMMTNLFLKQPGWRAAEGFGQPALGYPE
jgi:hypothetical protein